MRVVCFDLDDTLYKEIDYLKSAYKEIASYAVSISCNHNEYCHEIKAYKAMLEAYYRGGNAFEALNDILGLELSVSDLLRIYREHIPGISLDDDVRYTLDRLKSEGILLGIVTDGREQTQWNKIRALGLTEWIDEDCIIINSSIDCFKPDRSGYDRMEAAARSMLGDGQWTFIYVGDNLQKDFICPRQKGWFTICLKDDGRNIHSQDFSITPREALPDKVVDSLLDIVV